jgi:transposase-like protein
MTRTCTICSHPEREAIERKLLAGESYRDIAGQFGVSKSSLERHHRAGHIAAHLAQAHQAAQVAQADDLLAEVQALRAKAYSILLQAEGAGDLRTALQGIRTALECLTLLAKLLGELDERQRIQVNILALPEWRRARATIVRALEPYPEARLAVAQALRELDGDA